MGNGREANRKLVLAGYLAPSPGCWLTGEGSSVGASSLHLAESQLQPQRRTSHRMQAERAARWRGRASPLETALTESVLWMYANGHNQRSL